LQSLYSEESVLDLVYFSKWKNWFSQYIPRLKKSNKELSAIAESMNKTNPCIIPRNYMLQEVIDDVAKGSREKINDLMIAIQNPYQKSNSTQKYFAKRPDWARTRAGCSALSCSS